MKQKNTLAVACAAILGIAALAATPASASTAKEYALKYCKGYETPNGDKWSDGRPIVATRYGEARDYADWKTCVTEKTREFAIANDATKAEYNPGEGDRAYGEKYCSKESVWEGITWYGRAAEASQPHRTMTNSNVYKDKNQCIEEKTKEAYYAGVPVASAPFAESTIEVRAKDYCRLYEYETPGQSRVKHRHFGPTVDAFATESACMEDTVARMTKEAEQIAKVEGKIMQPYDATQVQVAANATPGVPDNAISQQLVGMVDKGNSVSSDCQIWLCMPAGFPMPQCSDAYNAFKKRMKKGRPPMPPFESCSVSADPSLTGIASANGKPPKFDFKMERVSSYCDKSCRDGVGTERVIYRTQVTVNGVPTGQATQEARNEAPRSWLERAHDRQRGKP